MKVLDLKDHRGSLPTNYKSLIANELENEHVIVYPTDTLYGLGVDACSKKAVAELFRLKKRENSPVSVLLDSVDSLLAITPGLSSEARHLIRRFLPGALTVICRSDYPFAGQLYSAAGTIGFRVPGDNISTQIPQLLGRPISTTSVNPVGERPAASLAEVKAYYGEQLALMLDIGPFKASPGSTVIDLSIQPFKILREGEMARHSLQDFLN